MDPLELRYCVEQAKEVLLSLEYPSSSLVTPVEKVLRDVLRPGLSRAAELFAADFVVYMTSPELGLFRSDGGGDSWLPNVGALERLRDIKPEDCLEYLFNGASNSNSLRKLLRES